MSRATKNTKTFSRMSVETMLRTRGGSEDIFQDVLRAKTIKACDGKGVFTDTEFTIESVKSDSFRLVLAWIAKSKGNIVWQGGRSGDNRMIVSFPTGIMHLGRSRSHRTTVRRYRRGAMIAQKASTMEGAPGAIDIVFDLSGLQKWVDSSAMSLKAMFANHRVEKPTRKTEKKLHVLHFTAGGTRLKAIAKFEDELERGNYTELVASQFDAAVRELSSPDPSGRLLIIHGPPGTGKTYMVRSMINAIKKTQCVLVPSQYVPEFTKPSLGNFLIKRRKPTCLIIEDADQLLVQRMADNITAINSMLNLTDGMFGMVADVRLICTTNARRLEMDPALLRKGRLLDQIHVDELDPAKAGEIYTRLTGLEPAPHMKAKTLADVYAAAREAKNA